VTVGLHEIRGQSGAVARLDALLQSERLPHALLFEGPDGVGKMRAAQLLAQILLCADPPRPSAACGRCGPCQKLQAGTHADFTVVTTDARHIKIDEIREAERALRLRALEGPRKVVLFEDVHRVTVGGQNALLKTLEEPPTATHLILTTSRVRWLVPTIVSRCQRVAFGPIPEDDLVAILRDDEGLDDGAARLVAALAHGSLGRARASDVDTLVDRRNLVARLDAQLDPGSQSSVTLAMQAAQDLAADRAELAATLDLWVVWLRDQLIRAAGVEQPVASADRISDLDTGALRGRAEVLHRARAVLEARRQLDLPYNLNAQLVAEQLCLALSGRGRMVPVPA
jgi:DNA polymerase-3 subunit delta'